MLEPVLTDSRVNITLSRSVSLHFVEDVYPFLLMPFCVLMCHLSGTFLASFQQRFGCHPADRSVAKQRHQIALTRCGDSCQLSLSLVKNVFGMLCSPHRKSEVHVTMWHVD